VIRLLFRRVTVGPVRRTGLGEDLESPLVGGDPTHDFFLGYDPTIRPFNSVYFSATLSLKISRLLKRGLFAPDAPQSPVLIEIVSVKYFPVRHLRFPPRVIKCGYGCAPGRLASLHRLKPNRLIKWVRQG
jgi:hypothetical protein